MDMLATARKNRIKALKAIERKRTTTMPVKRPVNKLTSQIIQFQSTRLDAASPLQLA